MSKLSKEWGRGKRRFKEEVKRAPENISEFPEKAVKEIKRIPENIIEAPGKIAREIERTPKNVAGFVGGIDDELKRWRDRFFAELSRLWERGVSQNAHRFSLTKDSQCLIDTFLRQSNFPYTRTYPNLEFYDDADNMKFLTFKGTDGITFKNKIYLKHRIDQADPNDLALIFHEMVHTYQYYKYGRGVFTSRYIGEVMTKFTLEPSFEKEAYDWERRFFDWLIDPNRPTLICP